MMNQKYTKKSNKDKKKDKNISSYQTLHDLYCYGKFIWILIT